MNFTTVFLCTLKVVMSGDIGCSVMFLENANKIWGRGKGKLFLIPAVLHKIKCQFDLVHDLGNCKFFLILRMALNLFLTWPLYSKTNALLHFPIGKNR